MKLLFVTYSPIAMDVTLPEREPLGGSESCIAYLARALARNGHDVSFAARLPPGTPARVEQVRHVPLTDLDDRAFLADQDFDAVIALSAPAAAEHLKRGAPDAFHVAWLHLLPDQSAMAPLAAMTRHIDCAVFVSQTQRAMTPYRGAAQVIGNGIAPAFENMFESAGDLQAAKQDRAAYTSMPYRGLHLLVDVARGLRGNTRFDIYSAMQTYRAPDDRFADLYAAIRDTSNARYHGVLAQPALAAELRSAAFLAYPCAFVETYCIAALEAIAAGLKVIATDLGALKETTLGFADLLPLSASMRDADVVAAYRALLEKNAAQFRADPQGWAVERFEQSRAVNQACSWRTRASAWEALLQPAVAARRSA
jgi:glycosyltransferase involved in cell wall biosynthesis